MAALTSAISILEVITAYFVDEKGWSRNKATLLFGGVISLVGVFCSLSYGDFNITNFMQISFFDFLDELSSKYMLPIGGALTAIFILKKWSIPVFLDELLFGVKEQKYEKSFYLNILKVLLIISSLIVMLIIVNEIFVFIFPESFHTAKDGWLILFSVFIYFALFI